MPRHDFAKTTKEKLAQRVAYRCSNPDCRVPTVAASDESSKSLSSIGVAAHICAASKGGRRYDYKMTEAQRKSIENGIWLCQSCSKLIDTDEITYSVALLKQWKTQAEETAKAELGQKIPNQKEIETLAPLERLKIYLYDTNNWQYEKGDDQFHYNKFPEFTIGENTDFEDDKYNEPWVKIFPDKFSSRRSEYICKYQATTLSRIYLVSCDGGRFLTAEPKMWCEEVPIGYYHYKYYLIKSSIDYLVAQMIIKIEHPQWCREQSIYEDLVVFESEADALKHIETDFFSEKPQYIYYEYNNGTEQYTRIKNGKELNRL